MLYYSLCRLNRRRLKVTAYQGNEGKMSSEKKKILFLCTGNSCRSQMAEGWARSYYSSNWDVYSAGTHPRDIDPRAIKVMAETGVDIAGQRSKHMDELIHIPFDLVVTVCDSVVEECPVFPRASRQTHRQFDDPPSLAMESSTESEALACYRRVRDEIRQFVEELLGSGE